MTTLLLLKNLKCLMKKNKLLMNTSLKLKLKLWYNDSSTKVKKLNLPFNYIIKLKSFIIKLMSHF